MGDLLSFIVGINTLKWLREPRYDAMMQKLPFDIGILVEIMLTEWKTITFCDPQIGYEAIMDELYTYDLEDLNIAAAGMSAIGDYLAPYTDLIVEIIYDFHGQTRGQVEPILNNANYSNHYLKFDGFHGPNAILLKLVPQTLSEPEPGTPSWLHRSRDMGFIAQDVQQIVQYGVMAAVPTIPLSEGQL